MNVKNDFLLALKVASPYRIQPGTDSRGRARAPSSMTLIPIGYILGTFAMCGRRGSEGGPNDNAAAPSRRKPVTAIPRWIEGGYRAKIILGLETHLSST